MTFSRFFQYRAARHLLGWGLVLSFFGFLMQLTKSEYVSMFGLRYSVVLVSVLAAAIYAHYWLLTHLLERRRYALYVVSTLAVVLVGTVVLSLVTQVHKLNLVHIDTSADEAQPASLLVGVAESAANVAFALIMATVARYVRRGIISHFQMQQLRALQLETELSLLKAQVNQHFLFNTLNNL